MELGYTSTFSRATCVFSIRNARGGDRWLDGMECKRELWCHMARVGAGSTYKEMAVKWRRIALICYSSSTWPQRGLRAGYATHL